MPDPRPIFLLGLMGAGKSTLGRALAQARGSVLIDLDARIERLFATTIPALFSAGEPSFRAHEHVALRTLLAEPGFAGSGAVVATGGGIVVDPRNLPLMQALGPTVYLRASIELLVQRLTSPEQRARRPLIATSEDLAARLGSLLAARREAYERCTWTVDAEQPTAALVGELLARLA